MDRIKPDICVIGAGSGGLSVAAAAAQFGVDVVLVEKGEMGGDCLNYGCVPSKALLAAASRAQSMRDGQAFGIKPHEPEIDFTQVHDHIHGVIASIAPHDSEERFTKLGVKVIRAPASFEDPVTVIAGNYRIRARRYVIATGSSPAAPPVPGLDKFPYLTNETIFNLKQRPEHLVIIGGGPIGMEMAQGFRRLGAKVSVVEMFEPLGKDDPELTGIVLEKIRSEGVDIRAGVKTENIEQAGKGVRVHLEQGEIIEGTHLLVAAGRKPNTDGLGLEAAGIAHDRRGITVNSALRTSNRRVYAIGDVAGGFQFTHMANYHAGLVIRSILFRLPAKADYRAVPWVTYTDPELAHVGLSEAEARKKHDDIRVLRQPLSGNDRAKTGRETEGLLKVVTTKRGVILGATLAAPHAGEIIQPWILAISKKMSIRAMTSFISPYPTYSEVNKSAAIEYYRPQMSNKWLKRLIRFLARFG